MTMCNSATSKEQISFREQKNTSFHLLMFPSLLEEISWCSTQHISICASYLLLVLFAFTLALHSSFIQCHLLGGDSRHRQPQAFYALVCGASKDFCSYIHIHAVKLFQAGSALWKGLQISALHETGWMSPFGSGVQNEKHNWFTFKPHSFITVQGIIIDILTPMQLYFLCHFFLMPQRIL